MREKRGTGFSSCSASPSEQILVLLVLILITCDQPIVLFLHRRPQPLPKLTHSHTHTRARSLSSPTLTLAAPDVLREDLAVPAKLQAAESARRAGLRGLRSLLARPGQEDEGDEARSPARPPPHHQGARLVEDEKLESLASGFPHSFCHSGMGMTWQNQTVCRATGLVKTHLEVLNKNNNVQIANGPAVGGPPSGVLRRYCKPCFPP